MAEPFLAEIRIIGFNFPPRGWALCDGQLLPINQNQSLFALLGTTYGGDGETSFNLPDLRGRTPIHEGTGHSLGQSSGQEGVALTAQQVPSHDHTMRARNNPASVAEVAGAVPAQSAQNAYVDSPPTGNLSTDSVANAGTGQPHDNMQPYLTLHFIIALQGLFP
jgi:microcystin-dependent protein